MIEVEDLEGMLREVEPNPLILGSDARASLKLYAQRDRLDLKNVLFDPWIEAWPALKNSVAHYLDDYLNPKERLDPLVMSLVFECMEDHLQPENARVPFKNRKVAEAFLSYFPHWDKFYTDLAVVMFNTRVLLKDAEDKLGERGFVANLLKNVHPTQEEASGYFMRKVDFECVFLENYIADHNIKSVVSINESSGKRIPRIVPVSEALRQLSINWKNMYVALLEKRYS